MTDLVLDASASVDLLLDTETGRRLQDRTLGPRVSNDPKVADLEAATLHLEEAFALAREGFVEHVVIEDGWPAAAEVVAEPNRPTPSLGSRRQRKRGQLTEIQWGPYPLATSSRTDWRPE